MKNLTIYILFLIPFIVIGQNAAIYGIAESSKNTTTYTPPSGGAVGDTITLSTLKTFPGAFGPAQDYRNNPSTATIYEVTNLNDSGTGSLRAAFEATGQRIIIIKVEGLYTKSSAFSNTSTSGGDVAIWGQFAPGLGLTVDDGRFSWSNSGNIVIRHLSLQNGDTDCTVNVNCYDALNIYNQEGGTSIYLDHLSLRYGADQTFAIDSDDGAVTNTVSYCVLAEADPDHNTGAIMGIFGNVYASVGDHVFARNFIYNVSHRFPNFTGDDTSGIENYNNWVSNWKARIMRSSGEPDIDFIYNYYDQGNTSLGGAPVNNMGTASGSSGEFIGMDTYTAWNFVEGFDETPSDNQTNLWVNFTNNSEGDDEDPIDAQHYVSARLNNFGDPIDGIWDAVDVPTKLQLAVGHNRGVNADGTPYYGYDDKDSDYIAKTLAGTTETNYRLPAAWDNSTFTGKSLYTDSDDDNMPDWFEDQFSFLDKNDSDDMLETNTNWDFSSDMGGVHDYYVINTAGYTNLEICAAFYAGDFEIMLDGTNNLNIGDE